MQINGGSCRGLEITEKIVLRWIAVIK
jgi:hypothetical protein